MERWPSVCQALGPIPGAVRGGEPRSAGLPGRRAGRVAGAEGPRGLPRSAPRGRWAPRFRAGPWERRDPPREGAQMGRGQGRRQMGARPGGAVRQRRRADVAARCSRSGVGAGKTRLPAPPPGGPRGREAGAGREPRGFALATRREGPARHPGNPPPGTAHPAHRRRPQRCRPPALRACPGAHPPGRDCSKDGLPRRDSGQGTGVPNAESATGRRSQPAGAGLWESGTRGRVVLAHQTPSASCARVHDTPSAVWESVSVEDLPRAPLGCRTGQNPRTLSP